MTESIIIAAIIFLGLFVAGPMLVALAFDEKLREEIADWWTGRDPFERSWTAREIRRRCGADALQAILGDRKSRGANRWRNWSRGIG